MDHEQPNKIGYLNTAFKLFHLKSKESQTFDYHHHDFCKIVIFISGNVTYHVDGRVYSLKPWDVLLVNHSQLHKPVIDAEKTYERIIIWLDPVALRHYCSEETDLLLCFGESERNRSSLLRLPLHSLLKIKEQLAELEYNQDKDEFGHDIFINTLLIQFLLLLNRRYLEYQQAIPSEKSLDVRISRLLDYVHHHLSENLSVDMLTKKFFTSRYHLMRRFKEETGFSLHHYIQQKRLIMAKAQVLEGKCLSEVSSACGFRDYSSFVRAFKKEYGVSPKHYYQKFFTRDKFEGLSEFLE